MSENNRPRGVKVYPMPEEVGGPAVFGVYALCIRTNGDTSEVRMVHYEGVAYAVRADKPWRWTDYRPCKEWSVEELLQQAELQDRECDLADWVRTFGARLESNFHQIHWWATNEE
jgi:hypothetical protein